MDKPREKLLNKGNPKDLQTEELLSILLGHGTNKVSVYQMGKVIAEFLRSKSQSQVTIEDLMRFDGIGEARAMQILSALELGRRYYRQESVKISTEDWDFSNLKQSERQHGVHFFHHYTAKFIPQIPAGIIKRYTKPNMVVVDPFMGSGTTLVEAKTLGCHSYGVDTNPMAVKIAEAKTLILDEEKVAEIDDFLSWLSSRIKYPNSNPNEIIDIKLFDDSQSWFRDDVAQKLKIMLIKIQEYSPDIKNFIEVGISTHLKGISNARMDSVTPVLPSTPAYTDRKHYYRVVDNLTRDIPVYQRVFSQINRMKFASLIYNKETNQKLICKVINGDARHLQKYVNSCNLVVTSPPYWSAQNYQQIHMLSMKLFNLNIERSYEIGRNEKSYLEDMKLVFLEISKILQGYFALVIGHDDKNDTHDKLKELALEIGFKYYDTAVRRISNQVSRAKQINNEYIYVFKI